MSVANTALVYNLGLENFLIADDLVAGPAGARATAPRLPNQLNRCVISVANGCFLLPSIVSGEGGYITFVVNDSPNAIVVGAFAGETIGGVATAVNMATGILTIPAGQSGIFIPVPNGKGGTTDWRAAVIP